MGKSTEVIFCEAKHIRDNAKYFAKEQTRSAWAASAKSRIAHEPSQETSDSEPSPLRTVAKLQLEASNKQRTEQEIARYHEYSDALTDAFVDKMFRGTTEGDYRSGIFLDILRELRLAYKPDRSIETSVSGVLQMSGITFGTTPGNTDIMAQFVNDMLVAACQKTDTYLGRDGLLSSKIAQRKNAQPLADEGSVNRLWLYLLAQDSHEMFSQDFDRVEKGRLKCEFADYEAPDDFYRKWWIPITAGLGVTAEGRFTLEDAPSSLELLTRVIVVLWCITRFGKTPPGYTGRCALSCADGYHNVRRNERDKRILAGRYDSALDPGYKRGQYITAQDEFCLYCAGYAELAARELDNLGISFLQASNEAAAHLKSCYQLRMAIRKLLQEEYQNCRSRTSADLHYPRRCKEIIDAIYSTYVYSRTLPSSLRWYILDGFRVVRD